MGAYVGLGWPILEHLGVMLGSSWLQLGPLGTILALSWAIFGSPGAHLGSSWLILVDLVFKRCSTKAISVDLDYYTDIRAHTHRCAHKHKQHVPGLVVC